MAKKPEAKRHAIELAGDGPDLIINWPEPHFDIEKHGYVGELCWLISDSLKHGQLAQPWPYCGRYKQETQ